MCISKISDLVQSEQETITGLCFLDEWIEIEPPIGYMLVTTNLRTFTVEVQEELDEVENTGTSGLFSDSDSD